MREGERVRKREEGTVGKKRVERKRKLERQIEGEM